MIERRLDEDRPTAGEGTDEADEESPSPRMTQEPSSRPPFDDDEDEAEESEAPLITLEGGELKRAIEAILFSLSEPIAIRALSELVEVSVHEVREAVEELRFDYLDTARAFRLEDIAGGVQILTNKNYDPWIRRLRKKQREGRLSGAALETLAVIAYKQPIPKADLEAIRGVGCGPILKTLMDRGLVHVVGRGEGLGRPLLYGTTTRFLESFGIASIRDLPQPDAEEARSASKDAPKDDGKATALFPAGQGSHEPTDADLGPSVDDAAGSLLDEEAVERAELAHLSGPSLSGPSDEEGAAGEEPDDVLAEDADPDTGDAPDDDGEKA